MTDGMPPADASARPRHPRAVAMLVCDRIIRDARTDRVTLVDLLDEVSTAILPLVMPSVSIYARLTDAAGSYAVTIDVVRREDLFEVMGAHSLDFDAADPLEDVEIIVRALSIRLPSDGAYDVRLWANGRFVHSVSLRVLRYNPPGETTHG